MAIHDAKPSGREPRSASNTAPHNKAGEFVALGIVIANIPQERLHQVISGFKSQPDLRLVKIGDTEAGESRYRIEVALPAEPDTAISIVVWRNVREALLAHFAADAGTFRISET